MEQTIATDLQPGLSIRPTAVAKRAAGPFRTIKLAIAGTCLLAGVYAVTSNQRYVQSDNAVVTAYLSSVRVPIEGTLQSFQAQTGAPIRIGERLGEIENARANAERIQDLSVAKLEASGQASAIDGQIIALQATRERLISRGALHARAVSNRLALQAMESEKALAEKEAVLAQATAAVERQQKLFANGIVSQASLEQLQSEYNVARQAVAAQETAVVILKGESDFAKKGVFTEQGYGGDVNYSAQRVDEIDLQLASLQQSSATLKLHADALQSSIAAATRYSELMHHADLLAPIAGTIWRVRAQEGERLNAGQDVVELIDCRQQFVLAAIPQSDASRLDLKAEARIKLTGEHRVRTGKILELSGQTGKNEKLAADVLDQRKAAIVRIAFPPEGDANTNCSVGHDAQVMLPKKHNTLGPIAAWLSRTK